MPFDKVSMVFFAFAHAYPLDRHDWRKGAELRFQDGQPDQAGRVRQVMDIARHVNPKIQFMISLGWQMNDWSYISADYVFGVNNFPASVAKMVRDHGFDGFDIDDEGIGEPPVPPNPCGSPSGCITQADFNGVVANIRRSLDGTVRRGAQPPFLSITPASGAGHVSKENVPNFDLFNPQTYAWSRPSNFTALGALPKQVSWGINTEEPSVVYPSPSDYAGLAGIFNWSFSADSANHQFRYTARIAKDVGYPPPG
jgi:GH18 family chitinase